MKQKMLLEVEGLSGGYEKAIIIDDISINVDRGEFVCIIGPNGSGKSTLMKSIVGFLKPFKGSISFKDKIIHAKLPNQIAKEGIGYVPQLDNVFGALSIDESILL